MAFREPTANVMHRQGFATPGHRLPGGRPPWRRRSVVIAVPAVALLALMAGCGGSQSSTGSGPLPTTSPTTSPTPQSSSARPAVSIAELSQLRKGAAAAVAPDTSTAAADVSAATHAVSGEIVVINTTLSYQGESAAGTGMVLTPTGLVLTNNHVIEGETTLSANDLGTGRTYSAYVVGYNRSDDVALIQLIGASGLPTVKLADSSGVRVGQAVIGVGNANGTGKATASAGSVSALDQSITASDAGAGTSEQLEGVIETDADIIPGDSGGPLVDPSGNVIGMDTAGSTSYTLSGSSSQGFAIPINDAVTLAEQIAAGQPGSTVHIGPTAFLGVVVESRAFDQSGAKIAQVVPGGPADEAGLSPGDSIVAINGQDVSSPNDVASLMLGQRPGGRIEVQYIRFFGEHTIDVTLTQGPPQ